MTDEQIKVLEELRNEIGLFAAQLRTAKLGSEVPDVKVDALTAALEYIRDMRELEANVDVMVISRNTINRRLDGHWHLFDKDTATPTIHDSLREAFKAVKGGKE